MKLSKQNKIILFSGIIVLSIIITSVVSLSSFSLLVDDGGGGGGLPPPTEEDEDPFAPIVLPDVPVLESVIPNVDTDGEIRVDWNDVNGATIYYVYRSIDGGQFHLIDDVSVTHFEESLSNGLYAYKIKSGNVNGQSDYSNAVTIIVDVDPLSYGGEDEDDDDGVDIDYVDDEELDNTITYVIIGIFIVIGAIVIIFIWKKYKKRR